MLGVTRTRAITICAVACSLCLLFASAGRAEDNMKLNCTGATVCTESVSIGIQTTSSALPTFDVTNTGNVGLATDPGNGTAYLVILVPTGGPALSFSVNGNAASNMGTWTGSNPSLYGFLGYPKPPNLSGPDFSAWLSKSQAANPSTTGFDVYVVSLGAYNTKGTVIPVALSGIGGLPAGTIISAFLLDNSTNPTQIANVTPLSQDIDLLVTPEPASITLFGSGLVLLGGLLRRRRQNPRA